MKEKPRALRAVRSSTRERIATALLSERLGLEYEWRDSEFEVCLPRGLPPNKGRKVPSKAKGEIEANVEHLVAFGCHRNVLYWCIGQLGSAAEEERRGKKVIVGVNDDESEIAVRRPLATRQDMQGLISKMQAAAKMIKEYRDELLLVANVCFDSIELPVGFFGGPDLPEEAVTLLLQSLHWVKKLAAAWESPNANALMKSKGVLFLLAYVWLCETTKPTSTRRTVPPRPSRGAKRYRLSTSAAQELAEIVHIYQGDAFNAGDLSDKLHDFATAEPTVFSGLLALATTLHEAASRSSRRE